MPNRYPPALPSAYPATIIYLAGVGIAAAFLAGIIALNISLLTFTLVYVLTSFATVRKELIRVEKQAVHLTEELKTVHRLVNSQSEKQLERIDQLEHLLRDRGVPVPDERKNNA
jgi:hypothetical protein